MRLPSKITPYRLSIIATFPPLVEGIRQGATSPSKLYLKTKTRFMDIGEFVQALDCLYALGKIDWDSLREELYLAD